jgi:hypothetical protein
MYRYLEAHGLLDQGPEKLAEGKIAYRRDYLKRHKQAYRKRTVSHVITCNPLDERMLAHAAQEHGMRVSEYVRMAALAYGQKKYLVPRIEVLYDVQQQLLFLRSRIERVATEKRGLFQKDRSEVIEGLLKSFEGAMKEAFIEPLDVETVLRSMLQKDGLEKDRISSILAEYGYQIHRAKK